MAASCALMYLRVCSIAAEPAGRGPMATIWRRCSHAREESNFSGVWAHAGIALTTINAEIAENAEKTILLGDLCVDRRGFMIAYRGERNRAALARCRAAAAGRSSARNRAAC